MSLYLLLGRVARQQAALLFYAERAAVLKFADEVGVELVAGRLKPEGSDHVARNLGKIPQFRHRQLPRH